MQLLLFFSKVPDVFLMSSHVYKQINCVMIFYFYLICFTFSVSYSVLPFHLVCFPVSPSLFFLMFFLKFLSNVVEKLLCVYICSNYRTVAFISHASKVMLKILQARLQQYVNHELPNVQAGFRKGRGVANI